MIKVKSYNPEANTATVEAFGQTREVATLPDYHGDPDRFSFTGLGYKSGSAGKKVWAGTTYVRRARNVREERLYGEYVATSHMGGHTGGPTVFEPICWLDDATDDERSQARKMGNW